MNISAVDPGLSSVAICGCDSVISLHESRALLCLPAVARAAADSSTWLRVGAQRVDAGCKDGWMRLNGGGKSSGVSR